MGRFSKKHFIVMIAIFGLFLFPSTAYAEESIFSVTVPMSLPIAMDSQGKVATASDAKITNNSVAGVKVSNVKVHLSEKEGWTINPVLERSTAKVDGKEIAMTVNNHTLTEDGALDGFTEWFIAKNSALALDYKARLPSQSDNRNELIGHVVFTIEWADVFYRVEFQNPNMGGTIDGAGPHLQYIVENETITDFPTVTPDQGYSFVRWVDENQGMVDENTPITMGMILRPEFEISQAEQTTDDGNYIFNIETGTIVEYIGTNKNNLTIPSTLSVDGRIYEVKTIGENAFQNQELEGSLTISQGIETIKANAFWNNNLESVYIPNSVSSIGNSAFRYNNIGIASINKGKVFIDNYRGGIENLASNAFNNNGAWQWFPAYIEYTGKASAKSVLLDRFVEDLIPPPEEIKIKEEVIPILEVKPLREGDTSIAGKTNPEATIRIKSSTGEIEVTVDEEGNFIASVPALNIGDTIIVVRLDNEKTEVKSIEIVVGKVTEESEALPEDDISPDEANMGLGEDADIGNTIPNKALDDTTEVETSEPLALFSLPVDESIRLHEYKLKEDLSFN